MVAELIQDQSLQLSEGPLWEQRSQDQRKAGQGILAISQRNLWQSTVDCAKSNTDRVMLQLAARLLPRVAAKAQG